MTTHDASIKAQALLAQISPVFGADRGHWRVMKASGNPMLIAALLFKLAQERKQTNELMAKMDAKYDELSFLLKSNANNLPTPNPTENLHSISLLPEADQKILSIVEALQGPRILNTSAKNSDTKSQRGVSTVECVSQIRLPWKNPIRKKVVFVRKTFEKNFLKKVLSNFD